MRKALHLLLVLSTSYICWQCATQTTPGGGPKDEKAPVLDRSFPKHKTKNFKDNTVQLTFDEFIKLKDPREEIIITPSVGKDVEILAKNKALTIRPKLGWAPNTTYTISFRESIQDITEGNTTQDLYLAFSTGPIIDSLSVSGSVKNALTENIPEKITVALYTSDTFNIFKHAPNIITKTDKKGNFKIENLKSDNYFIYAFEDKNKNLKVDAQNESFGFHPAPIYLKKNVTKITIPIVKVDNRPLKITRTRATGNLAFIKFNKNITSYTLTATQSKKPDNSFGDDQTEINVYMNSQKADSIPLRVQAVDSIGQRVDTVLYVKKASNKQLEEKVKLNFEDPTLNTETGSFRFSIQSSKLITGFNEDSVQLKFDSLQIMTFKRSDFSIDTTAKKLHFKTIIDKTKLPKETKPQLITGVNFLKTIENDSIKPTKRPVKMLNAEETGSLSIEVKTESKENFIVQLIAENKIVQTESNQKNFTFKYLPPATYKIRLIIDSNNNGKWDPGNYSLKQVPETITYFLNNDKKTDFPIRSNWEVGPYSITF